MRTRPDNVPQDETRWPARVGRGGTEIATVIAAAFGILGLGRSLDTAISLFAATLAIGCVVAGLLQFGATLLDEAARGVGRGLRLLRRPRRQALPVRQSPAPPAPAPLRPVAFRVTAPVDGSASRLAALAAAAVSCRDLLTRRILEPGDEVFLCLGRDGRCGAAFPRELRNDLRTHGGNRCPACGETGRFADTVLPGVARRSGGVEATREALA